MKERFALLAAYFKEKFAIGKKSGKEKRKSMILSIVALVEVLAIAIVSVSAWVETISTIKLDLNNGTIDNYVFTNANIGYGNGYDGNTIDLTKYFRQAGDVHLASATSANGTDVYFPTLTANGEPSGAYRKATVNDKNVNYIDFSFNVTAKGTKASFYFDKVPTIKVNDADADEEKLRVSFFCDGSNTVVCGKSDSNAEVVAGTSLNTKKQESVKSFGSYTGSTAESPLFTVPADSKPHKVTMRVWLQDDSRKTKYAGQTVTIDNFKLITQSPQAGELTFSDKTTGDPSLGAGWATKNNRAIWINQAGKSEYEKLSKDSSGNYFIKLGSDYTDKPNATVTFYSCESKVTSNPQNSYVAKWTTTLQAGVDAESQTFTAYGYKDSSNSSNNGYGTWGDVQKILLSSEDAITLPMERVGGKYLAVNMYMNGNSNPIAMTFDPNETEELRGWIAYMPEPNSESSKTLRFSFTNNSKSYNISAPNRGTSVNFVVTSASTGYWAPPAIVSVYSCEDERDNNATMGTVSVTGGMDGATRVKVTKGTTVTLNATPTDGNKYRFIGWYSDPEFNAPVTLINGTYTANDTSAEHKFYAKFQRQYKVEAKAVSDGAVANSTGGTVKISGGEAGAYAVGSYLEGQNTSITATPKEGYDFMGWYSDEKCIKLESQDLTLSIKNIQANHLYYAKFMIKQFSVTAVANHPNDKKNSTVQFSSPSSEASDTRVTVKVNYNGSATFVANAGEGYEFDGWYSDENCQKLVSKTTPYTVSSIKTDYTLYAKFKIINLNLKVYSVTEGNIDGAGGTVQLGTDAPAAKIETTVEWGTLATLTAKENANYEFKGWFTDPQCNIKADNKILDNCLYTENTVQTAAIKKDLTLYAKFSDVSSRTVTANAVFGGNIVDTAGTVQADNSPEGATSTAVVTNGNGVSLVANTKPNYKFMGWYSDRECTNSVASEQQFVLTNVDADCEYYALFKLQSFSVNAVVDGDSVGTVKFTAPEEVGPSTAVTVSVDYDGSATFVANPAEGYDFDGWYNDSSDTPVSNEATYVCENIKADFTLHARFKLKEFEVKASAVLNGAVSNACGTVQAGDTTAASTVSTVAKWGESVALTATPKSGYSFSGWYTDLGCTQPYTDDYKNNSLTTVIKTDTIVYAKFEVEQKRVVYLQVPDDWKTYNDNGVKTSSFSVYMWVDNNTYKWFPMKQVEGNIYSADITGTWTSVTNIIFTKMNTGVWDDWNGKRAQTVDETIPNDGRNCFIITDNTSEDKKATGKWATYPFASYEVVLDAVSCDSAGSPETNGFTGGKVSVGGVEHTSAVTNTYPDQTTVTATAVCNEGYQFAGWFSDSDCINNVANNAELSISVNSSVHYYAKFVKSETKTYYFMPNDNWKSDGARFAAYVHNSTKGDNNGSWYNMSYDEALSCYSFTLTVSDGYNEVIFCRMKGSPKENKWKNCLQQVPASYSGYVSLPTDGKNCYELNSDGNGGSWITK